MCHQCPSPTPEEMWPIDSLPPINRQDKERLNLRNWIQTLNENEYILSMDVHELVIVFPSRGGAHKWDIRT